MYEREHKEVMAMKDEVRKVKDERRRNLQDVLRSTEIVIIGLF